MKVKWQIMQFIFKNFQIMTLKIESNYIRVQIESIYIYIYIYYYYFILIFYIIIIFFSHVINVVTFNWTNFVVKK